MKNAQTQSARATRQTLTLDTSRPAGCTTTAEDAPHYLDLAHTVCTSTKLSGPLFNNAEWEITRRRDGVPSDTEDGYSIAVDLRFGHGDGDRKDVVVHVCGVLSDGPDGFSPQIFGGSSPRSMRRPRRCRRTHPGCCFRSASRERHSALRAVSRPAPNCRALGRRLPLAS